MNSRRGFLKACLMLLGASCWLPWTRAWAKKIGIRLEKAKKLKEVGGWMILKIKGKPVMLIRDSQESVLAFDPTCTHEQCTVGYSPKTKTIDCTCHKSSYDLSGKVLDGPAPAPLKRYTCKLSKGRIILDLG